MRAVVAVTEWLAVVPIIDPVAGREWAETFDGDPSRVVVVNNSGAELDLPWTPGEVVDRGHNMGVAASWNMGARKLLREGREVLLLCSTSIRFGEQRGADVIDRLDDRDCWGVDFYGVGWHLIAFSAFTFRTVGLFDEGFHPAYSEDSDFLYRMQLCGGPTPTGRWLPMFDADVEDQGQALALTAGLVRCDLVGMEERYFRKWGGRRGQERYVTPWDSGLPTWWW